MDLFLIVILLLSFSATLRSAPVVSDGPVVEIAQGQLQGTAWTTPEGRNFNAFLGIPFGKAPVGELRYKPPVPADPWEGVFQATTEPPPCIQVVYGVPPSYKGVEDCLQLTVYTPVLPSANITTSMPVQVFIHGGSYISGDIHRSSFGPERYLNSDMVLVLMNYRLSVLGFLSTGDDAALGNYGLLDQNLALRWVRDNIAAFGGNPNDVTLAGQSAGSASVLSHILSPMSAGLFHKAIPESGSALCPWAFVEDPLQVAQSLGALFNCSTDDTYALVDCLRDQDAGELQIRSTDVTIEHIELAFVPVVENPNSGLFITEDPWTLLEEGRFNQVPTVMGFVRDEGAGDYASIYFLCENITDEYFSTVVPTLLRIFTDYRENLVNVSYAIRDEYFTDIDLTNKTAVDTTNVNLISDMYMKSWIVKTIELISSHNVPTYMYAFNYVSSTSSTNFTGEPDVSHSAELKYLFYNNVLSAKDEAWDPQFLNLWVNFILQGNPSYDGDIQWTPTPPGQSTYLDINEAFTMVNQYDPEKMDFWLNTVPAIVNG